MAPLKGITDALFRSVYMKHFKGLDGAIAPFINPQRKGGNNKALLKDLLPERNCSLPLVPQLLNTDPEDFITLANHLADLGYDELNWNLGCPVPMVARKKRGSGLLPYPDQIIEILERIVPNISQKLSIKMRLGYHQFTESLQLIPRLNEFPLSALIIHARLGIQLYRGPTYPEKFRECLELAHHSLFYNGDITSVQTFKSLKEQLPEISHWMIGRGLLANPHLPAEINGSSFSCEQKFEELWAFHQELFNEQKERLSGPGHLLGKMKQVWIYLIGAFPSGQKALKKITRASTEEKYLTAVMRLFESATK